jgi:hypothetical protein
MSDAFITSILRSLHGCVGRLIHPPPDLPFTAFFGLWKEATATMTALAQPPFMKADFGPDTPNYLCKIQFGIAEYKACRSIGHSAPLACKIRQPDQGRTSWLSNFVFIQIFWELRILILCLCRFSGHL